MSENMIFVNAEDVSEGMTDLAGAAKIAVEIQIIKRRSAQSLLSAAIEIGRLLCEAKQKVPYGEWGKWLQENVDYSLSNANNMMRLYTEQERSAQLDMFAENGFEMFEGMNPSQVLALLDVPAADRRQFIEEHGAGDLSVRELKAAIRAEKAARELAEQETERERKRASEAEEYANIAKVELTDARTALEELKKSEGEEAVKKVEAERDAAIKKAVDEAVAAAKIAEQEAAAARIKELEDKLKSTAIAASPHLVRFKTCMETLQADYARMVAVVEDARRDDPAVGEQLAAVMEKILESLKGVKE